MKIRIENIIYIVLLLIGNYLIVNKGMTFLGTTLIVIAVFRILHQKN